MTAPTTATSHAAVAAAAHRCLNSVLAAESNRSHHVCNACGADDGRGPTVNLAIPYTASRVIVRVVGANNGAIERTAKSGQLRICESFLR